jgi:DNA-binding NtrC family response regulator
MKPAASGHPLTDPLKRVLVVDADPDLTGVLSSVLKSDEWTIVHAADNQAILNLTESGAFDLIITGAKTTGREDVDLLRKIRRVRPHVRLIILPDQSTPADVVTAMREGAFSYFSKPFSARSLGEMGRSATLEPAWDDGIEFVSATPEWVSVIARCDLKTADRLVQFFNEMLDLPDH